MTQKELLYIEDAISHETIISDMINNSLQLIDDSSLISFLKSELKKHESTKEKMMKILKGCSND